MRNETNLISGWALLSIYISLFGCVAMAITSLTHLLRFESPWGVALAAAAIIAIYTVRSRDLEFLSILLLYGLGISCCLGFSYLVWGSLSPDPVQTGRAAIFTPDELKQGAGWILVVIATVLAACVVFKARENSLKHSSID